MQEPLLNIIYETIQNHSHYNHTRTKPPKITKNKKMRSQRGTMMIHSQVETVPFYLFFYCVLSHLIHSDQPYFEFGFIPAL